MHCLSSFEERHKKRYKSYMETDDLLTLSLVAGGIFIIFFNNLPEQWTVEARVLLVTLIVVAIYTRATHQLKEKSQEQLDLQLAPFLTVGYTDELRIKNMGKGVAVNVSIERSPAPPIDLVAWKVHIPIANISCIKPEDNAGVIIPYNNRIETVVDENGVATLPPDWLASHNYMHPNNEEYTLTLTYQDGTGRNYKTVVKTDKSSNDLFHLARYESPTYKATFKE